MKIKLYPKSLFSLLPTFWILNSIILQDRSSELSSFNSNTSYTIVQGISIPPECFDIVVDRFIFSMHHFELPSFRIFILKMQKICFLNDFIDILMRCNDRGINKQTGIFQIQLIKLIS